MILIYCCHEVSDYGLINYSAFGQCTQYLTIYSHTLSEWTLLKCCYCTRCSILLLTTVYGKNVEACEILKSHNCWLFNSLCLICGLKITSLTFHLDRRWSFSAGPTVRCLPPSAPVLNRAHQTPVKPSVELCSRALRAFQIAINNLDCAHHWHSVWSKWIVIFITTTETRVEQ